MKIEPLSNEQEVSGITPEPHDSSEEKGSAGDDRPTEHPELHLVPDQGPIDLSTSSGGMDSLQTHLLKLARFEHLVLLSFAQEMLKTDSRSFLGISGSYASRPANVRALSDVDTLIISEELKDPGVFVDHLKRLNELARDYEERFDVQVVFFTRQALEASAIFLREQESLHSGQGDNVRPIVPCHFLYYQDADTLFLREPHPLAVKLLRDSKQLTSNYSTQNYAPSRVPEKLSALEVTLWDTERSLSELVLNQGLLPQDYLARNFCDSINSSLRIFADHLPLPQVTSTDSLSLLDKNGRFELSRLHELVERVRRGEVEPSDEVCNGLIQFGQALLGAIQDRLTL